MSDPYIRGINDSNLTNKFSELTDTQREKLFAQYGSKKDAKAAYKDARTRFAGDEVADNPAAVKLIDDSAAAIDASATFPDGAPRMDPEEDNIYKYDTRAYGAGSQKGDDGIARLSSKDLRNLSNQGYSAEDIIEYSQNITASGEVKQGDKARNFLEKLRGQVQTSAPQPEPTPTPQPEPPNLEAPLQIGDNASIGNDYSVTNGQINNGSELNIEAPTTATPTPIRETMPEPQPIPGGMNIDAGFEVGGDLINSIGNTGNTDIDLSNSQIGDNGFIGNDSSGTNGLINNGSEVDITAPITAQPTPRREPITATPNPSPSIPSFGLDNFNIDSPFSVGGDLTNSIGNSGNTTINASGAKFGDNAEIGNDYSSTTGTINNGNKLKLGAQDYLQSFMYR